MTNPEGTTMLHDARQIPVLVITGPVGAGKSTVAAGISRQLDLREVAHALIDMDYLRWVHPEPPGDPFAAHLGYRNLAAIWINMQAMEPRYVVVADVVETRDQKQDYLSAMPGTTVTIVRLDVPIDLILDRLEGREDERSIDWYRARAPELQEIMVREKVADLVIDVGHRTAEEVAVEILDRVSVPASS